MVSSTDFANSLTVSGSASAHYTLAVMSIVALIFVPLVLLYQGWTYHVFRAESAALERATRWPNQFRLPAGLLQGPGERVDVGAVVVGVKGHADAVPSAS